MDNEKLERRFVSCVLRAEDGPTKRIKGTAAVYNQEAEIGRFREVIKPGAFARLLAEKPDVIGAFNHDWNKVLGRTTAGTLRLEDTITGLTYEIDINEEDPEALSAYAKVKRGDVHQSSFAFTVRAEEWQKAEEKGGLPLRSVVEVDELYDVSPVTFPAYPTTSASVRSKLDEFSGAQVGADEGEPAEQGQAQTDPGGREHLELLKRKLEISEKEI